MCLPQLYYFNILFFPLSVYISIPYRCEEAQIDPRQLTKLSHWSVKVSRKVVFVYTHMYVCLVRMNTQWMHEHMDRHVQLCTHQCKDKICVELLNVTFHAPSLQQSDWVTILLLFIFFLALVNHCIHCIWVAGFRLRDYFSCIIRKAFLPNITMLCHHIPQPVTSCYHHRYSILHKNIYDATHSMNPTM